MKGEKETVRKGWREGGRPLSFIQCQGLDFPPVIRLFHCAERSGWFGNGGGGGGGTGGSTTTRPLRSTVCHFQAALLAPLSQNFWPSPGRVDERRPKTPPPHTPLTTHSPPPPHTSSSRPPVVPALCCSRQLSLQGNFNAAGPHLSWRLHYLCHQRAALSPDMGLAAELGGAAHAHTCAHTHSRASPPPPAPARLKQGPCDAPPAANSDLFHTFCVITHKHSLLSAMTITIFKRFENTGRPSCLSVWLPVCPGKTPSTEKCFVGGSLDISPYGKWESGQLPAFLFRSASKRRSRNFFFFEQVFARASLQPVNTWALLNQSSELNWRRSPARFSHHWGK